MEALRLIELFHLVFIRQLSERIAKDLYCIKGGCNLRFFFKSIRYSEDLDIDAHTISVETLRNNVRRILGARSFLASLKSNGIELSQVREPKQTGTTQRWKVALEISTLGRVIPTKIEFSRREVIKGTSSDETVFEAVDPELVNSHKLYPILATHYTRDAACQQKILALIHRGVTQARDVFDLESLLKTGANVHRRDWTGYEIEQAIANVQALTFDDFNGQVLAYLDPQYQDYYKNQKVWDGIVRFVLNALELPAG